MHEYPKLKHQPRPQSLVLKPLDPEMETYVQEKDMYRLILSNGGLPKEKKVIQVSSKRKGNNSVVSASDVKELKIKEELQRLKQRIKPSEFYDDFVDNLTATGISESKINQNNYSHIEELAQQGDITAKYGNRNYELNFKRMAQEYIETEDPKIVLDRKHKTAEELEAMEKENEELKQKAGKDEVILNNHVYKLTPMEVEIRDQRAKPTKDEEAEDAKAKKAKEANAQKLNKAKASMHSSMNKSRRALMKKRESATQEDKPEAPLPKKVSATIGIKNELNPVVEENDNLSNCQSSEEEKKEWKCEKPEHISPEPKNDPINPKDLKKSILKAKQQLKKRNNKIKIQNEQKSLENAQSDLDMNVQLKMLLEDAHFISPTPFPRDIVGFFEHFFGVKSNELDLAKHKSEDIQELIEESLESSMTEQSLSEKTQDRFDPNP